VQRVIYERLEALAHRREPAVHPAVGQPGTQPGRGETLTVEDYRQASSAAAVRHRQKMQRLSAHGCG
jgi:hypothetical protein